jgi:hypothetical protein
MNFGIVGTLASLGIQCGLVLKFANEAAAGVKRTSEPPHWLDRALAKRLKGAPEATGLKRQPE